MGVPPWQTGVSRVPQSERAKLAGQPLVRKMPSMTRRTFLTATAAVVGRPGQRLHAAANTTETGFPVGGAVRDVTPPIGRCHRHRRCLLPGRARLCDDTPPRRTAHRHPRLAPAEVLRIGNLTIAASPCETFAETGHALKAASTAAHTFAIGLANGHGGYLPTAEQHRLGGYETWAARSSLLAIDTEAAFRRTLVALVRG